MRINGKDIASNATDQLIETLYRLPCGFSERTQRRHPPQSSSISDYTLHTQAANDAFKTWEIKKQPEDLDEAYAFAEKAARAADKPELLGAALQLGALFAYKSKDPQRMVEFSRTALKLYEQHGQNDRAVKAVAELYYALIHSELDYRRLGQPERAEALQPDIEAARRLSTELWPHKFNEPQDPTAHRVEQGEVGFSADAPLGTDNICDCVAVMVRDPITKKTALAHIDAATSETALDAVFARLPKHAPHDPAFEVRMVGARLGDTNSNRNLTRVVDYLKDKDVDILSADIREMRHPSTLVVDPQSFTLREAMPFYPNPDQHIANGIKLLSTGRDRNPLRIAFDLTTSPDRAPVLISSSQSRQIERAFVGATNLQLHACYDRGNSGPSIRMPSEIEMSKELGIAYQAAIAPIKEAIEQKMDDVEADGKKLGDSIRESIYHNLQEAGLHIGANAAALNQPLLDFVAGDFLRAHGGDVSRNVTELRNFNFNKQPFDAMEAKTPSSFQSKLAAEKTRGPHAARSH